MIIKKIINRIFGIVGLKLSKTKETDGNSGSLSYITARETTINAQKEGLSVCDYVEKLWNQEGETQKVIDNMEKLGAFTNTNPTICEIGAGTGRYMEKIIAKCKPKRYESYETAADWAKWLEKVYPIISQPTDGVSLQYTADDSVDLIHSHGVFVYLPFLDSLRYFKEIDRVSNQNVIIVFDCLTEDCLNDKSLNKWLESDHNFPQVLPEKYIFNFFPKEKYDLMGNFFTPYGQGRSKYFVFKHANHD